MIDQVPDMSRQALDLHTERTDRQTRRRVLVAGTLVVAGFGVSVSALDRAFGQPAPATPACHDGDEATVHQTAGPYFKANSPERADFTEPGIGGRVMEVTGFVLNRQCRPIARALIDVWQADAEGVYDLKGFRLRGHLFSGTDGRYMLRTIIPGLYPGRTRHIHVRVQAPNRPVLTTQLYFPGERMNLSDTLYRSELAMRVAPTGEHLAGQFDFVLDLR
jgi:protocatechuate 3,4-dioxygenase beta subunit